MNIIIIEDEKPARKRLKKMLAQYNKPVNISAELRTVAESALWFRHYSEPDLILLDIQLTDGLSLELFNQVEIQCPVIFITAFDEYLTESFTHNGISYLLKPVKEQELFEALDKYRQLRTHFTGQIQDIIREMQDRQSRSISRILARLGDDYYSIEVVDIAYFISKHKITTLVTRQSRKFAVEKSLSKIELILNPRHFFRLNRNYLAHIHSITSFQQYFRGKLSVRLQPDPGEQVIVSQAKAGEFRSFMEN